MKKNVIGYVPTSVGPTKLEIVLAEAPKLGDEQMTKVCIIQDLVRIGKLLGHGIPTPEQFDYLYAMSIPMLEAVQHNAQIELNTVEYFQRMDKL